MAREIESVNAFTHKSHEFGMEKETTVVRCDDGAVYEFERATDSPKHRLVRRFQPDGTVSLSRGVLPSAVKETLNDLFGKSRWSK